MNNIELINASAGSGKTYNLTNRVVDIIKNGADPEALMATTFTNKAAAELRERIRVELLEKGYAEEANRISDGFIGTVNSICARLLKEYSIEAGMSPAIETMPEEDRTKIFNISIDNVMEMQAEKIEPVARRMGLNGGGSGYGANADWRDYVKRVVDLARSNRLSPERLMEGAIDSWEAFEAVLNEPCDRNIDKELMDAINVAVSVLELIESPKKTTLGALEELKKCQSRIKNNSLSWEDWMRLSKLKAAKDGQEEIAPVISVAEDVLSHPKFHADVKLMIEGVFNCAASALMEFDTYKKEHGLMDFTDQETHILDMAQNNESFKASLRDRIRVLMVDEFQDTSPIQLALFLALNELAGKSVWVGDPKQAIYGFRGTDPQLMDEVVSAIGESKVLDYSWRSKEKLINFTNELFSEAFHEIGREKVCLKIPLERTEKARGGYIEEWHLLAKNNPEESGVIASGVRDLLSRFPEIKPGDIAVLCRTNNSCIEIAKMLNLLGIRASVGQGNLMDTRECRMAIDALRYMNNKSDTLALAEIIKMSSEVLPGRDWLGDLMENPDDTKEKWNEEALLGPLNEGRDNIRNWTPLEALEQAISRMGLLRIVKSWANPDQSISNLDTLRGVCGEYIDMCSSHRSTATIDGFINYLNEAEKEQAKGIGENTVNLVTYHGSKGLEWPWVVLSGLDKRANVDVFGVNIDVAEEFDPSNPLANRKIRFWPWPFGKQKSCPLLDDKIDELPIKQKAIKKAESEERRLLYVGMTRAKDGLVMAFRDGSRGMKTGWIDAMKDAGGKQVIEWDTELGEKTIMLGNKEIPVTAYLYSYKEEIFSEKLSRKVEFLSSLPEKQIDYPIARISPSLMERSTDCEERSWKIEHNFGSRIRINGKPKMDKLGNAVHAYFAVEHKVKAGEERLMLAQRIMKNWDMEEFVEYSEVVDAGNHLNEFIGANYPECKIHREWPMFMRNEQGQVIQGWIDMLIETKDGYVIIDHKDYPGRDVIERAEKYKTQLIAYEEAVEKSTGRPVVDILLHFPISGLILSLK